MNEAEQERLLDDWLDAHGALIRRIVRAYAFGSHDREDLFQEVAFQLWLSIPRFRGAASVTTWIYRVALYSGIAWSRRERRQQDREQGLDLSAHLPSGTREREDPRVEWLYERIARLDPIDRSLLLLRLEGLGYREMAQTLGISESNVGVKIHRIKKALASQSSKGAER